MYTRECPRCKKVLYCTIKGNRDSAERKQRICPECNGKDNAQRNIGKNNPFYGKTHTLETINKIRNRNFDSYKTNNFREKMSKIVFERNKNVKQKSNYEYWVDRYGIQIANEKMEQVKQKLSNANKGKNNPMYGKPSPVGSGNGWSGWYNGWYFRSLKELSYMINVIIKNKLSWKTGETLKIKYVNWDGVNRTYSPDFIINENKIIEVKPKHLFKAENNICKFKALRKYCKENNYTYEIIDPEKLMFSDIKKLHDANHIKFIDRYEVKYQKYKEMINE